MDLKKLRENTTVKTVQNEIGSKSLPELWKELQVVSEQIKIAELVETAIKDRIKKEMGDDLEKLEMYDGLGAYYQYRTSKEVSMSSARALLDDADTIDLISKIDLHKAKEVLSGEVYKQLEDAAESIKTIKILKFGKLK